MAETKEAAGLTWTFAGDAWEAEDARGRYQVLEFQPGAWTALWFPRNTGCGCGKGAEGGLDYDGFDQAAAAIADLAASRDSVF